MNNNANDTDNRFGAAADEDQDYEPIVSAGNPELARRMENMRQEIQELREQQQEIQRRAQQADGVAQTALEVANEKDEEIEALRRENEQLRDEVEELRESNAMVAHVNDNRAMDVDDRAVVCIQTLANDAGSDGRAAMMISEGWSTLGREFDRTRMYDVYRRAESLVDNDNLCWFQKESRGHTPPSRLILDRTGGDLPDEIAGNVIRRGGSR